MLICSYTWHFKLRNNPRKHQKAKFNSPPDTCTPCKVRNTWKLFGNLSLPESQPSLKARSCWREQTKTPEERVKLTLIVQTRIYEIFFLGVFSQRGGGKINHSNSPQLMSREVPEHFQNCHLSWIPSPRKSAHENVSVLVRNRDKWCSHQKFRN